MFSYSWWILMESISVWLTAYIGTFIVGVVLSDYYLGLYKTSMTTVNQITALITAATSMPLFAALSRLKHDDKKMVEVYRKYIQAISVLVIPLGVGMWLYRDFITDVLLGSQWGEAATFIGLWGITSSVCLVFGTYCNGYFNAKGKTYLSFVAQLLHLVVLIPVIVWSSKEGYETLYWARSLVRFELILVELIIMKFSLNFPISKLFYDVIPITIATLAMACFDYIVHNIFGGFFWNVFTIFLCIIVYFTALLGCFPSIRKEILEVGVVKKIIGKFSLKKKA
jgi:PST family polysaccharide transporter